MSSYDPNNYEKVKDRKKRFYKEHDDGRIIVELLNEDIDDKALFKATIFKNKEDQKNDLPLSIGYALEIRDKEISISKLGKEYESINYTSWIENCEESAVGRALDNANFFSFSNCSQEEIEKAKRNSNAINNKSPQVTGHQTSTGLCSSGQAKFAYSLCQNNNIDFKAIYGVTNTSELTSSQAKEIIEKYKPK